MGGGSLGAGVGCGVALGAGIAVGAAEGARVGAAVGDGVGTGTPTSFAMSARILWMTEGVSHSGYLGGTMRRCFTDASAAFPKSVTRLGSELRGRSVQVKPLAARKRSGAFRIVFGPMSPRIASSSVCWRDMRA